VRLSADALRHNARLLRAGRIEGAARTDALVADAWGHGAEWVRSILAGFEGVDPRAVDAAALYGLAPGTRAVMRLSGTVLSTKALRAGEGVSYGYAHRAPVDTRVALVSGGYAQGVVRGLGGRIGVRVGGRLHPVVGRIAMDVSVLDIGDAELDRGDEAVFFGDLSRGEPSVTDWAQLLGWSVVELVSVVGRRAPRREET
jgi:alanine racemase